MKHEWFYYKESPYRYCKKCGVIENKNNTDNFCVGKVDIKTKGELDNENDI